MALLGGVISNLLSLGAKLLKVVAAPAALAPSSYSSPPAETDQIESDVERFMEVLKRMKVTLHDSEGREISDESVNLFLKEVKQPDNSSAQAAVSSSSPPAESHQIEADLKRLMELLERIKATLYDAEQREIRDESVKLWLKELKGVAYHAEDVLEEYHYEVLRAQVEARNALSPNSCKRKQVQMPDGMLDQIKQIKSRFDEISNDRKALQLSDEDGPRCCNSELQIAPTSHFVVESDIIGREGEKEKLINLLSSDSKGVSVLTIVGMGGLGKTTLAKLAYNDQRIRQRFDKFGWLCVSEDFKVERLTKEAIDSITRTKCDPMNLDALQEKISKEISGKRVLLVLDDVWNENSSHWESFRAPFVSAALVKILVTTRNEPVARIMQTVPTFNLSYLLEEQCWQLFQSYAFGGVDQNEGSQLVEIGKQIIKKCGGLPLAIKSIASLLKHEKKEDSWRDILGSELWKISNARKEILAPLQISYTRLPTYLKPCFLFCSMFPKDYLCRVEELVCLWIYQGYIESNGKKNPEKTGQEYANELLERSFVEKLDGYGPGWHLFKLHDMVHDLARFNSENGCYSIEVDKIPDIPKELYHLHIQHDVELVEPLLSEKFDTLRTLIVDYPVSDHIQNYFSTLDFSKAKKLRALAFRTGFLRNQQKWYKSEFISSFVHLKYLRYLLLAHLYLESLPECICSLYSLQNLTLVRLGHLQVLPESIGNLVSLEELVIIYCCSLKVLPVSLCQLKALTKLSLEWCTELEELPNDMGSLTNLQILQISGPNRVRFLPPSMGKIKGIQKLKVELKCNTIRWLKDFVDLEGTLSLSRLNHVPSLTDVQCANLVSLHNLECLGLFWTDHLSYHDLLYGQEYPSNLYIQYLSENELLGNKISKDEDSYYDFTKNEFSENKLSKDEGSDYDFSLMVRLQPHHNLRTLYIFKYSGNTFPEWVGNPTSCASLERIYITGCENLTFLPFGNLYKLKYLIIYGCNSLRFLHVESLPLELQELEIFNCIELTSVPGIQKLKSLVKLSIGGCDNLHSLVMDAEPSLALGLENLMSLRSLRIYGCPELQLPGLKEWCLQHNITYMIR